MTVFASNGFTSTKPWEVVTMAKQKVDATAVGLYTKEKDEYIKVLTRFGFKETSLNRWRHREWLHAEIGLFPSRGKYPVSWRLFLNPKRFAHSGRTPDTLTGFLLANLSWAARHGAS
jgi:hypothetical protein